MKPSISQYLKTLHGPIPALSKISALPVETFATDRLQIASVRPEDLYDLYECRNAPRFVDLAPGLIRTFTSFEDAEQYLAGCMLAAKAGKLHPWILRRDQGFIGYVFLAPPLRCEDGSRLVLEYGLDPRQWGHGYAREALVGLISHHFRRMPRLNKIEGSCLVQNTFSQRAMRQAGMRLVATLEEHHLHEGRFHDLCLFEILRRHYLASLPAQTIPA